jgi:hypothetical protein
VTSKVCYALPLLCLAAPVWAQEAQELALIKALFAQINPISIEENIEYCGYIGLDEAGNLIASGATPGEEASCLADDPVEIAVITASWHTHGGHSPDYFNEVPSTDDYEGDEEMGIDGWVATPGGRLWYIDTTDGIMSQVCGVGCLPMDAGYDSNDTGVIEDSYTYDELVDVLGE